MSSAAFHRVVAGTSVGETVVVSGDARLRRQVVRDVEAAQLPVDHHQVVADGSVPYGRRGGASSAGTVTVFTPRAATLATGDDI